MKEPSIFIIDKNPLQGNLVKYQLAANRFFDVWLFASVEECLYRLRKQSPDFLITEYELGDYTGDELLRMSQKISPRTQVIFFTSHDDAGFAASMLAAGARDYVVKSARMDKSINELATNIAYIHSEAPVKEEE
ncbi:MAG TPA: response regulator [Bacteroidales bacterium]|nr:response regulator [Bacteroidales bacterium]HPS72751.1 response regulator [Bacteroidales bacterium]